jgi:hypothetical protein
MAASTTRCRASDTTLTLCHNFVMVWFITALSMGVSAMKQQSNARRDTAVTNLGAIAGVASIAIALIGVLVLPIWEFPSTGTSALALTDFLARHADALKAVMLLNSAGVALWLPFGAGICLRMRAPGRGDYLSALFAFCLVAFVTLLLVGFLAMFVLMYTAPQGPQSKVIYDFGFGFLAMSGFPTTLSLSAYAVAVYRTRVLPRITVWLAVVAAVGHLVLIVSLVVPSGFFSLEGPLITLAPGLLFAWILVTSLLMLTSEPPTTPAGELVDASIGSRVT